MKLYFVRHGETDWNKQKKIQGSCDIELNEKGLAQALETAKLLKDKKIDIILSSPLKRAKKTAEIIAEQLNVDVEVVDELKERNFGGFEGQEIVKIDFKSLWRLKEEVGVEGLEQMLELFKRVQLGCRKITEKYSDKNVLVVAHNGVCIPIRCYFDEGLKNGDLVELMIPNCSVLEIL